MNPDSTSTELLELLSDSRAYTQYFVELGVETIELSSDLHPTGRSNILSRTLPTKPSQSSGGLESSPPPPPKAKPILSDPPTASPLFDDPGATQPASLQSAARGEDVW